MSKTILTVGLPNCGKSTLFNALTGAKAKVGNWGGVTVDCAIADLTIDQQAVQLTDLPGFYDLSLNAQGPEDEAIAQRIMRSGQFDGLLNVVDATQLARHLYLTVQLRELGIPMVVVLNKWDAAHDAGLQISLEQLEQAFDCPVIALSARQKQDHSKVQQALRQLLALPQPNAWQLNNADLAECCQQSRRHEQQIPLAQEVASARHQWLHQLLNQAVVHSKSGPSFSERVDHWALHPIAGLPIFLLVMYLTFMFAIHVGSGFIDFFDIIAGALFVDGTALLLTGLSAPEWLIGLLANGVGAGVQTVATFIPVVAFLFVALGVLETSGYMARAAFVVEGAMQKLGLPGKAFVPLIVGFGCNVPSITGTRTLEQRRQRIMAGMMAPFMSCGARLPVYALFATAFFPDNGQNLVFLLYLIGIVMAVLTGLLLRHTLLMGSGTMTVMELPDYELPTIGHVLNRTWQRTRQFVLGAGKVIVVVVTLLSFFNTMGTDGSIGHEDSESSLLAIAAQTATPLFAPMGITQENWPATVGIITGIFAKEAVVGTLSSLYSQNADEEAGQWNLLVSLNEALATIPEALVGISVSDPLGLDIGDVHDLDTMADEFGFATGSLVNLKQGFGTQAAAFAYLLFVLLYTPCAAVLGAMAQEFGKRWTLFSAVWTFALAYMSATLTYQVATLGWQAWPTVLMVMVAMAVFFAGLRYLGRRRQQGVGNIPVIMQE